MSKGKGESSSANTRKKVESALETTFSDEGFHILMELMSRFPHYSFRNILILRACCPNAQYPLRRFRTWLKYGRVVREDEKAIRICTYYGDDDKDQDDGKQAKPKQGKSANEKSKEDRDYWYQPLFDISQTDELEDFVGEPMPYTPLVPAPRSSILPFNQDVPDFVEWMSILSTISPLPLSFSPDIQKDSILTRSDITIRAGITQLRAIRAALIQMVHALAHTNLHDRTRLNIEAESAVYIVSKRLGFDIGGLLNKSGQIEDFADDHDKDELKAFLDCVQKIAMYLIDSIEGEREARRIGFGTGRFCLLLERKTATKMFRMGHPVWMVDDEHTMKPVKYKSAMDKHNGPFAVERAAWFGDQQLAA